MHAQNIQHYFIKSEISLTDKPSLGYFEIELYIQA